MKKRTWKTITVSALVMLTVLGGFGNNSAKARAATPVKSSTCVETANGKILNAIFEWFKSDTKSRDLPKIEVPRFEDVFTPAEPADTTPADSSSDDKEQDRGNSSDDTKQDRDNSTVPNRNDYRVIPASSARTHQAVVDACRQAVMNEEPGLLFENKQEEVLTNEFAEDAFWLTEYTYWDYENGDRLVVFSYGIRADQRAAMQQEIDAVVQKLRDDGVLSGATQEEILLKIHDYLCKSITYNRELSGKHIRDLYGALVLGDAVCVGYAYAFSYLCRQAGIPCRTQRSESGSHVWNVVELNGESSYCVDVTWDDPDVYDAMGNAYILYDNFLISHTDLEMHGGDHRAGVLGSYGIFSWENSYWERNNYKQSFFSVDGLCAAFGSQFRNGHNVLSIRYTDASAYEQARSYLNDNSMEGTWNVLRQIGQLYDGEYVNIYWDDNTLTISVFLNA